ncbi:MAG: FAD-dependent oxidoreductase, partial [Acidimicrobiia bacterium]|nr:FAD-dependent oxidoreductase [Acidimicrobiia bacterium]
MSAQNGTKRRIIVIGAGPGGICAAIGLRQAGYDDVVVLDKAEGVGGTWWHNSYPGCACDVPTHLYSFSFELNTGWSRPYATQPEIQRYRACGRHLRGAAPAPPRHRGEGLL